ncbi:MAG: 2-hydroxyacyl-CoA dehydratase [Firmicutes bacterium]|jgi:benzoyl-CoA reductase/2-hydroxyglutaryl-CoA dehydratase subunit BcrC/BadD/HgdB|nr:2-hydroxyacyl-CoA dehydratase [Bacillota bacterium]
MENKTGAVKKGLYDRVYSLFSLLQRLPPKISAEELEGLAGVIPDDSANSLKSLFKPSIQDATYEFVRMLGTALEETKRAREEGKKVVLAPFNFPPEIIHAFDNLVPITTEVLTTMGVVTLEGQGERYWDYAMGLGLPDHLCSANTIDLGSTLTGLDFKPDAIISGCVGTCDVNAKTHEFVSLLVGLPQIPLEKAPDNTKRGFEFFKNNYYKMIRHLEELAGEELTEEKVRRVAEKVNRCTELYDDIWELKKEVPCPVPGVFSLFVCATRFAMWGRDEGIRVLEKCVEVARRNLADEEYRARGEIARVVWVYLSYYYDFLNFYDWMEEMRISNMGDALQLAFPETLDLTSKETMLEGMIESAWNNVMTRQMGGVSMSAKWADDIVYVVNEWGLDGCIYCGHHSCKQTWSVFSLTRNEVLKRTGVPTLGLHGDSWIRTMTPIGAIQEEIEQFINNVVLSKRRRRRVAR